MRLSDERVLRLRQDFPALARTQAGRPLAYFDGPGERRCPRR